jgi:rhomboid family GlyGly-CTERM serine protease
MRPSEPADGIATGGRLQRVLRSLDCDGARGVALALVGAALLAATLGGEVLRSALRYDRNALAAGEWWRLATGHLVHLNFEHAAVDVLALVLLWMLFARDYSPRAWLLVFAGAAAAIDLGLWVADSTLIWYVGSSGVLHGVFAAGVVAHLRRGERDGWLLGALLVAKLTYEQSVGALPLVPGPVVVDAHLYGALGGVLAALVCRVRPLRAVET